MKNKLFTLLAAIAVVVPVLATSAQAQVKGVEIAKPTYCFEANKTTVFVPYNLTKAQVQTLKMIKASSQVIDSMRVAFSLENNFIKCEQKGRSFDNAFTKYVAQTLVAYPSLTTYTGFKKRIMLIKYQPQISLKATATVGVGYSPQAGYSATATITPNN